MDHPGHVRDVLFIDRDLLHRSSGDSLYQRDERFFFLSFAWDRLYWARPFSFMVQYGDDGSSAAVFWFVFYDLRRSIFA